MDNKANHKEFEEAKGDMCKALEELMADVIEERVAEKVEERLEERVAEATKEADARGMERGELINSIKMFKKCLRRGDSKQEAMDFAEIEQALADELYEEFLKEQ